MNDNGQYQGSQAYAHKVPSEESVSPNSGSVNFSRTLIHLRGVTKAIDLSVQLSYTSGTQGSFGLTKGWGLGIPFTIPNKSLTAQGKTFVVDPNWSDATGWQSGLRYVNHHGMKFEEVIPAQPLPSGQPGDYSWRFRLADGSMEYFDSYGKLLEHDDIDSNSIYYVYVDPMAGPLTARIDYILDSWGQTVQFQYELGASLTVIAPDGGQTNVVFTTQGVNYIQDAMTNTTSFIYRVLNNVTLIDTISYPTGLQSRFDYILLSALDQNGKTFYIPACVQYVHLNTDNSIISNTRYVYGEQTTNANYTGASIGCRMGGLTDSSMDNGNSDYRYDVAILRLDANESTLQMSRVYYNYLHMSMEEEHYDIDSTGIPQPGYRTVNTYDIPPDLRARATSYNQPIQVEQFHYSSSAADYRPLRRSSSTYDDFGCPLGTVEEMWDSATSAYVTQKSVTSTYTATSWGGEILRTEIYSDRITGHERFMTYGLDANKRHIASSSVEYREDGTSGWKPWKTKSYTYDTFGRVTVENIAWSPGADIPQGSVQQYTYTQTFNFDATTSILTISKTDPLGNTGSLSYQMKATKGPLVKKTSPLGITETLSYDLLGRVVKVTDALGFTTSTSYSIGRGPTVQTVNTLGYITQKTHDVLGRLVQVADSGNQNTMQADRVLSQTEYDMVSSVASSTNELGLTATSSYDAFNRLIKKVDSCGNVMTFVFDDDKLTTEHRLNGDLRMTSIANGLSKPIKIITYADSAAAPTTHRLVLETVYDGFGKVLTTKHSQQPVDQSATTLFSRKDISYNVEDQPYLTTLSALPSTLNGNMDQVVRKVIFDIFGNAVTYTKTANYGDGRQYTNNGPVSLFNACNCLTKLTNQLGQVETNEFNADGRLTTMTRYDGTQFNHTYDALGHLLSSSTPDGTTTYEYLSNGRCTKITRGTATITRTYTPDGCISSTVFPDGRSQTYALDVYSRVIQEVDAAGHATLNTFDAFGRLATKQMGDNKIEYHFGTVNHTHGIHLGSSVTGSQQYTSEIAYDGFGRQNQITDRNQAGTVILQSDYLHDSRGHLTSRQVSSQTLQYDPSVNNTRLFTYDGFNQLTSDSTSYPQVGVSAQNYVFEYDGNWNVIQKTINGSSSQFTYNALDQRQDGFVYDTNGRLSSDPTGRKYHYDFEDRLVSTTSQTTSAYYMYSPDSSLANRTAIGVETTFYYNCGAVNSTLDTTGTGQSWTSYLLDPSRRIAAEKDGQDSSVFLDSQNSVVMSLGTTTATYDYQAYGAPTADEPMFGWQREFADPDNGLIYLRSRYYQPDQMAFITMDSSRGQENRYAYCNGDPINLADGGGHDARNIIGALAGFVVGIAVGVVSGGLLAPAAVDICAVSLTTIGVAAASVSGAAGTLAGDATTALIDGQSFTAARAGEDLLTGAIGGAVGAGSGGLAAKAAMRMALDKELSRSTIMAVGYATTTSIGGAAGGFASSGTAALLHHESPFSMNTAFSTVIGFVGGVGGSMAGRGLPSGSSYIPVELTEAETHLIVKAAIPAYNEQNIGNRDIFLMNTPAQNDWDWDKINTETTDRNVLRTQADGAEHYTIVAHGEAGRMYASVAYKGDVYYRPINPTLLARTIDGPDFAAARSRDPNLQVKLISCNGGWSNAQKIANALQIPVWAAYKKVGIVEVPKWHLFNPKP